MIRTDLIASIPQLIRRQSAALPDKVAYSDRRASLTYASLDQTTANLAGHLQALGIVPGDRIAILLPNSVQWIQSCFAIARAGALGVPISYESALPEIAGRLADAGCRALITTDAQLEKIAQLRAQAPALEQLIVVDHGASAVVNHGASAVVNHGAGAVVNHGAGAVVNHSAGAAGKAAAGLRFADLVSTRPPQAPRDPDDIDAPAFIIYTSGTTGRPKGVLLSVRSMLWVVAACWAPIAHLRAEDHVLSPLPLFHSYALNLSVLAILATGASEHIMEKYSTQEALALLATGRFTLMPGVPTMFHYLLEAGKAGGVTRFDGLRLCISAGAIMPGALNTAFEAQFSVPLLDGYGITETATMVTLNWLSGTRKPGSCGIPVPGLAVRIIDPSSGLDAPSGAEGELIVRGPNLMSGYYKQPEATAVALRNGWYHTGDLAKCDSDGYLTITGRLKELIIRGGQNIAPAEVEAAVASFDGVLDCAVVGAPHDKLGEVPVVFVVPRPDAKVNPEALLTHCRNQLSSYKVPAAVHFVDAIPRTGSGKTMRFKLAALLDGAQPATKK